MDCIMYGAGTALEQFVVGNDDDCPSVICVGLTQEVLCCAVEASHGRAESQTCRLELLLEATRRCPEITGEVQNQIGPAAAAGKAESHCSDLVPAAEIAQRRVRRLGDARYIWTHFTAGVEEPDHIQRLFLMAEV